VAGEPTTQGQVEPRVPAVLPLVLYGLLALSAAFALVAQAAPGVQPAVAHVAPWVFLAFAGGFVVYRVALVMARRYSAFKAFWQITLAALFFMLLLRSQPKAPDDLLHHTDARVREVAARLCGYEDSSSCAEGLPSLADDSSEAVRTAALEALRRRGIDGSAGGRR
jgi:hypothetical protein